MILNIYFEEAEKLFLAALANMFASQLPHKGLWRLKNCVKVKDTYEKCVESCKIICNKVLVQIWTFLIWAFGSKKKNILLCW